MSYFVFKMIPAEQISSNILSQIFPYFSYIQFACLYNFINSPWIFMILMPSVVLGINLVIILIFFNEFKISTKRNILNVKSSGLQDVLNIFFPIFPPLLMFNFLQANAWPFFCSSNLSCQTFVLTNTIIQKISIAICSINIFIIFAVMCYIQVFLQNRNQFRKPNFSSISLLKQLIKDLHKIFLVVIVFGGFKLNNLMWFPLINVLFSILYIIDDLFHCFVGLPFQEYFSYAIDITFLNMTFHLFLINQFGGYVSSFIFVGNIVVLEIMLIYIFYMLKRKRSEIHLPEEITFKNKNQIISLMDKVIQISENGPIYDRISLLHDLAKMHESDNEVLFGFITKKNQNEHSGQFQVKGEFKNQVSAQIYQQLEIYLSKGIDRLQNSVFQLNFIYVKVLFYHQKKQLQSLISFFDLEAFSTQQKNFDMIKEEFNMRKVIEKYLNKSYNHEKDSKSVLTLHALKYNQLHDKLSKKMADSIAAFEKIWIILQDDSPQVNNLIEMNKKFYIENQKVDKIFKEISKISAPTFYIYKKYFAFLTEILFEYKKCLTEQENLGYAYRKKKIQVKSNDLNISQTTDDSEKCFFLLSGERDNFSRIKYISDDLRFILKFDSENMMNKKIDEIMPYFMQGFYSKWIDEFFKNQGRYEETIVNKQHFDVFIDKNGYFHACLSNLRLLPNFDDGILFALFITPVVLSNSSEKPAALIFDRKSGEIYCFNKEMEIQHGLKSVFLKQDEGIGENFMKIQNLFPELLNEENMNALIRGSDVKVKFYPRKIIDYFSEQQTSFQESIPQEDNDKQKLIRNMSDTQSPTIKKKISPNFEILQSFQDVTTDDYKYVGVELLKQISCNETLVFVIALKNPTATQQSTEIDIKQNEKVKKETVKTAKKPIHETSILTNQPENQKSLVRQITCLKLLFIPYVMCKTAAIIVIIWLIYQLKEQIDAQLNLTNVFGKKVMLMCNNFLAINVANHFGSPNPLFSGFSRNLTKLHDKAIANIETFKLGEIIIEKNSFLTQSYWNDPLYKNWLQTNKNPDLPYDQTIMVELNTMSGLSKFNVSLIDFTYYFFTNSELYFIYFEENILNYINDNFLVPFKLMTSQLKNLLPVYFNLNRNRRNVIYILIGSCCFFILIVFLTIIFILKKIMSSLSSIYLSFGYLTDSELSTLIDSTNTFKRKYMKHFKVNQTEIEREELEADKNENISEEKNAMLMDSERIEINQDKDEKEDPLNDNRLKFMPSFRKKSGHQIKKSKITKIRKQDKLKMFAREIHLREIRTVMSILPFLLIPLILFVFVFYFVYQMDTQISTVFSYFNIIESIKCDISTSRVYSSLIVFSGMDNGNVTYIKQNVDNIFSNLQTLDEQIFELKNQGMSDFYENYSLLNTNFCNVFASNEKLNMTALGTLCGTYPTLTKGFKIVVVNYIQDRLESVMNPSSFPPVYLFKDFIVIMEAIQYTFDFFEVILKKEFSQKLFQGLVAMICITSVIYLISLCSYMLFWIGFVNNLEQSAKERNQILRIFDSGIIKNEKLQAWLNKFTNKETEI